MSSCPISNHFNLREQPYPCLFFLLYYYSLHLYYATCTTWPFQYPSPITHFYPQPCLFFILFTYWNWNFPINPHVRELVGLLVGRSVCHNFLPFYYQPVLLCYPPCRPRHISLHCRRFRFPLRLSCLFCNQNVLKWMYVWDFITIMNRGATWKFWEGGAGYL